MGANEAPLENLSCNLAALPDQMDQVYVVTVYDIIICRNSDAWHSFAENSVA